MKFSTPEQLNAFDRMFPSFDVNDLHEVLTNMVRRAMIVEASGTAGDYTEEGIAAEALAELIDVMLPHDELDMTHPAPLVREADPEFERLLAEELVIEREARMGRIKSMTDEMLEQQINDYRDDFTISDDSWAWYKALVTEMTKRRHVPPTTGPVQQSTPNTGIRVGDIVEYNSGGTDYNWRVTSIVDGPHHSYAVRSYYNIRIVPILRDEGDVADIGVGAMPIYGITVPDYTLRVIDRPNT